MYVYFGEFKYQTQQQLLYKGTDLVPLKRNQAALLDFFLADPESIHNKNEILDSLWANQDVSQQVVFQTVSELRSILGSNAVRTFSKKGYKWNLTIDLTGQDSDQNIQITESPDVITSAPRKKANIKRAAAIAVIAVILCAILTATFLLTPTPKPVLFSLLASHNNQPINATFEKALSEVGEFSEMNTSTGVSVNQAFASPKLALKRSETPATHWLIWGNQFTVKNGVFLHYGVTHKDIYWQGYVFARTQEGLPNALSSRLRQLKEIGLFSLPTQQLRIDDLKAMAAKRADDPDILFLLATHYDKIKHHDVALSYLQKIIKKPNSELAKLHRAEAYLKIANIYKNRGQNKQAHYNLAAMQDTIDDIPVPKLHFKLVETQAWLAYNEKNVEKMNRILEAAENKFKQRATPVEPLLLFRFYILHSILAKKTADDTGKYTHLNAAQALLLAHNLDESNLAIVLYHFALFAQQEHMASKAKPQLSEHNTNHTRDNNLFTAYLHKILKLTRTLDNDWVHDSAFELLFNYYKDEKMFKEADALLPSNILTAKQKLLKATLLQAQNKHDKALRVFESAFDQARINYDTATGIEIALWLYQLSSNNAVAQAEYRAYLESNANKSWLNRKLGALTKQ